MKQLHLTRPLAFFDIESTGNQPNVHRIIELAVITLYPDGNKHSITMLFNPGEPISAENSAIHGFTDEMVKDKPFFRDKASDIALMLDGCDFGTFNGNTFDIPMLSAEFERAGVKFDFEGVNFVDAGNLFKIFAPRTLTAAVLNYLGKDHAGAHGAEADTQATIGVLLAMLNKHEDMPVTIPELALKSNFDRKRLDLAGKFTYNEKNEVVLTFGKWKGNPSIDPEYLKWMLSAKQPDGSPSFTEDTKNVCLRMLGRENMIGHKGPVKLPTYAEGKNSDVSKTGLNK